MNTPMTNDRSADNNTEKPPVPRAAAPAPGRREARDRESAPRPEPSEFRETVERGYGWGV